MRRSKVYDAIKASINYHEMNTHSFGKPFGTDGDRETTNYSIHEVIDLILDHLGLDIVEVEIPRTIKIVEREKSEHYIVEE